MTGPFLDERCGRKTRRHLPRGAHGRGTPCSWTRPSCLWKEKRHLRSLLSHVGADRLQEQHGLEPRSDRANLCSLEAGVPHHLSRIAVPMAIAAKARCQRHERILHPGSRSPLRAHMFEQQEDTPWLEVEERFIPPWESGRAG